MRRIVAAFGLATFVAGAARCKSTASEEFSIDVQILVPQGFPSYPSATFSLTVDEPAGSGTLFSSTAPLRGGTTESGLAYTSEIGDFDADGKIEWQMRFDTNPFGQTGVPLTTTLTGNLSDRVFSLVAVLKDGTTTIANATVSADSNNEEIRFGPAKRSVTIQLVCTQAVTGCVGADAGKDGGVGAGTGADAGVDAGADAGVDAGVDAGADAGPAVTCDPATVVGVDASTAYRPSIVADSNGAVHVAWYMQTAGAYRAFARTRSPTGTWESAAEISSSDAGGLVPIVRADALGNTYAVWYTSGADLQYWANRRTTYSTWGAATMIGGPVGSFWNGFTFAVGANGHGVLAWDDRSSNGWWNIQARTFDPDAGWRDGGVIADWDGGYTNAPRAIVDSTGRAMVYWCQQRNDGQEYDPWAVRIEADGGVQAAVNPNTTPGTVTCVDIVPAPGDEGRVLWLRESTLWSRKFFSNGTWDSVTNGTTIYTDAGISFSTAVATNSEGDIFAALAPTTIAEIVVRRFAPGQNWFATWVVAKNQGVGSSPTLTTVPDGGAWLAWINYANNVRVSRFPYGAGWSEPTSVVDTDGGNPSGPMLTPIEDGGLLLTWVRSPSGIKGDIFAATCR
ncbi:MAG: hypothetical protein HYY84_20215 [Deltaproteobacteria bacterium]|nr:hypothetical protein [Deltaproteobacteria bacterium]